MSSITFAVLREILNSKDHDNKGYVTVDELGECLQTLGFKADEEDLIFLKKHWDDNGNVQPCKI